MPGKANCCCPARVQHSVLFRVTVVSRNGGASQNIVRCEGGTRVLGRSPSRSRGEDGCGDQPVHFGAAGAH
jgi:hypothetical protein